MGWAIGWDDNWKRDIGYGVPAVCDHPDCNTKIDRGISYVCGGEPFGGEHGCGLFFCGDHLHYYGDEHEAFPLCERCGENYNMDDNVQDLVWSFTPKPDISEWTDWKMTDDSWAEWAKGTRN